MTATAAAPPAVDLTEPENARFDRDLETAEARRRAVDAARREAGNAPDSSKVRFDNPRFRSKASRRRARKMPGVYLGIYKDTKERLWHLRADGVQPRGVLIVGPPGSGKSACYFIPTLLATAGVDAAGRGMSAFVYDPKGELFALTAGYRRAMGHKVLLFAPAAADALQKSCHINILDSIRWNSPHEIADVQNIVKLILDPKDKAAEGAEAHWIVTGSILLECVILWLHYNDPKNCTLKGCYDYLTDPRWVSLDDDGDEGEKKKKQTTAVDEALKHMLRVPHAQSGRVDDALAFGWKDANGGASPYHPYIIHSAIEIQGKAPNEKSGVVSTTTRFLHPFRDEILAELTSRSDFSFDDLMNHETPVDLYFCIPPSDIQRLRVIVSLFLQLLVRAHTGDNALEYRNGVPFYRYRHRLLLAVDEYAQLGKQEQFVLALSIMRSYGLWPMLGVQSPNQIFDSLGKYQALTSMMYYKVFLKPNDEESATWISDNLGHTTKRKDEETYSGGRFGLLMHRSVRVGYQRGKLMEPETILSMPASAAIVTGGSVDPKMWDNPIWCSTLFWEHNREMRRRSGNAELGGQYPAPSRTDLIVHGPPKKAPAHPGGAESPLGAPAEAARPVSEVQADLVGAGVKVAASSANMANDEIVAAARRLIEEAQGPPEDIGAADGGLVLENSSPPRVEAVPSAQPAPSGALADFLALAGDPGEDEPLDLGPPASESLTHAERTAEYDDADEVEADEVDDSDPFFLENESHHA